MRMPRARFTVRGLMIATAIAAIALGLGLRSARLLRLATRHGQFSRTLSRESEAAARATRIEIIPISLIRIVSGDLSTGCGWADYKGTVYEGDEALAGLAASLRAEADRNATLGANYRIAARNPWLPVAPDPPPPK